MKKFGVAALTLALGASLAIPALAAEKTPLIAPPPAEMPTCKLVLNGKSLDLTGMEDMVLKGLLPMRLVAEADHGNAMWLEEEGVGVFYLNDHPLQVTFATGEISLDEKVIPNVTAQLDANNGVTYVPYEVLKQMEGYSVQMDADANTLAITTPSNSPIIKAGYQISEVSEMAMGMRTDAQTLTDMYHIPAGSFDEVFAYFPMMTSPDTLIVGKLSKNADEAAVKAALEEYRKSQEDTFSWYLSQNLPKVKDARMEIQNGYFFFLIADNADAGVEAFHTFAAEK